MLNAASSEVPVSCECNENFTKGFKKFKFVEDMYVCDGKVLNTNIISMYTNIQLLTYSEVDPVIYQPWTCDIHRGNKSLDQPNRSQ